MSEYLFRTSELGDAILTWLESNGLKQNYGAIILLLNYLVVSRFERRGFILHTHKKRL